MFWLWTVACEQDPPPGTVRDPDPGDSGTRDSASVEPDGPVEVRVTLDGQPVVTTVYAGGDPVPVLTDDAGSVWFGDVPSGVVIASHPNARTRGASVRGNLVELALQTIDRNDNEAYVFQDPGHPDEPSDTGMCSHCHVTIVGDWYASPHARSASNPQVHDVYAGTAAIPDAVACAEAGGDWWTGIGPGTGAPADRCYLGSGTLPDLDPACGDTGPCDGVATNTGGCADCHAPGIDGVLGGRDLLEATGRAYVDGIHCDVCHKVESVDLTQPPGVAGALGILRPSEPDIRPGLLWLDLTFGPYDDVPNPRMGSVSRGLFHEAELCGACHELRQEVLIPGQTADLDRWPDGRLPIHTTYSEWSDGPIAPTSPCQSCHMPPDPTVGNSADLGNVFTVDEGIAGGWYRPPGAVRQHSWPGPRQREFGLVALAAAIDLETELVDGALTVRATVTNTGAGHAIPTGEPLRALLLRVEATCDTPLVPIGGDVLPDWAGASDVAGLGDWTEWPGAAVGDRIRVVSRPGGYYDVPGWGPFGDGTFDAAQKGLPVEVWAGEATVVAVDGDRVTLDGPLPDGDVAYRVPALSVPADGDVAAPMAGAPGFAFARVLVDGKGFAMVPHHRAIDVRSDDRLMPQTSWTSTHVFAATCDVPVAHAVLVHRPFPWALAAERRWDLADGVIAEAWR